MADDGATESPYGQPLGEDLRDCDSGVADGGLESARRNDIPHSTAELRARPGSKRPRSAMFAGSSLSLAQAPTTSMPLGEFIALAAVHGWYETTTAERSARSRRHALAKELGRFHELQQQQEASLQKQQRASCWKLGGRVFSLVQRQWGRRGETFGQLLRVEFEAHKRKLDERKQEDLLKETEALTRRLLDSLLTENRRETDAQPEEPASPSDGAAAGGSSPEAEPLETTLSLLDTQGGARPLRDYQRSALRWMIHLYGSNLNGILADEMGLGKTIQTIALLAYYAEHKNDWGPHLIVVPTTVVLNWRAEFARWCPGMKVMTYIGTQKERVKLRQGWSSEDAFHVCITSYNLVVRDRLVFRRRPWGFLVLDEAHHIKNFMSNKWQSLFDLQAQYRLLLTGTPLQNSVMELWSLFHFLLPQASAFRSNEDFREWFSNPMEDMVTGRAGLNEEIVRRLQSLLRPFMLRRLKRDVESQLPSKSEKVVVCRLSRRQRFLYDDFMQLTETRQRIAEGGAGGVLGVLLALRKVCNHPDLFEERPTVSPFTLLRSSRIEVSVPRCALLLDNCYRRYHTLWKANLAVDDLNLGCSWSDSGTRAAVTAAEWGCVASEEWIPCHRLRLVQWDTTPALLNALGPQSLSNASGGLGDFVNGYATGNAKSAGRAVDSYWARREQAVARFLPTSLTLAEHEVCDLGDGATSAEGGWVGAYRAHRNALVSEAHRRTAATAAFQLQRRDVLLYAIRFYVSYTLAHMYDPVTRRLPSGLCLPLLPRLTVAVPVAAKFSVFVPAVRAVEMPTVCVLLPVRRFASFRAHDRRSLAQLLDLGRTSNRDRGMMPFRRAPTHFDAAHFASELWPLQVRASFSFPDKRLLIHDCGKLQFLQSHIIRLRREGHRMLIFSQFVAMLNILERFLALIGVAYLRIDGATKAELRQAYVDRFNEDTRLTCMILSTRSGGIGLNLTGADTVIFYDNDWNPTMDLQAQDRCHRIGQTRPVTIYRLISEHTVEEKILQKARERKKLNNIVIRGGQFHAIADIHDCCDDAASAMVALSDAVSLRSFFHDLDEDATVPCADEAIDNGPKGSMTDWREEMANVEDEEDRLALRHVEDEIRQRAAEAENEEAEVRDDDDGGSTPGGKDIGVNLVVDPGTAAVVAASAPIVPPSTMALVKRRRQEILAKQSSQVDAVAAMNYGLFHWYGAQRVHGLLVEEFEAAVDRRSLPTFTPSIAFT